MTHDFSDRNRWRVPSLRNPAITGPHFHNGSVPTLKEAVRVTGQTQMGRELSKADVADLVSFLESLAGEVPVQPVLPK